MNYRKLSLYLAILSTNLTLGIFDSHYSSSTSALLRTIEQEMQSSLQGTHAIPVVHENKSDTTTKSTEQFTGHAFGDPTRGYVSRARTYFDGEHELLKIELPFAVASADIKTHRTDHSCTVVLMKESFRMEVTITRDGYKVLVHDEKHEEKNAGSSSSVSTYSFSQRQGTPYKIELDDVEVVVDVKNKSFDILLPRIHGTSREHHVPVREK